MIPAAFLYVHVISIKRGKTMIKQLDAMAKRPALYENGTIKLWTDKHIAKRMLETHLDPDSDAATKNFTTVQKTVKWISSVAPCERY
jgi:hypothetical protein